MPQKSIRQALNEALGAGDAPRPEDHRDRRGRRRGGGTDGQRDAYGGVLGVTKGLFAEFGEAG